MKFLCLNSWRDLFTEVNHGPQLIANNICLPGVSYLSESRGGACAHNLMPGQIYIRADGRRTPYHKPHSTELAGMHSCRGVGDLRWYNNLVAARLNLNAFDRATLPFTAAGNVYTEGAAASKFDADALIQPDFAADIRIEQKEDGWYLTLAADPAWGTTQAPPLVTTGLLGKAALPNQPFTNPDGLPLALDTDYFGKKRNAENPFPGPFENVQPATQTIKVWPKQ